MPSYTVTTKQGYGSRIGSAIGGVVVGIAFILISFPLLFWNEGRAITTARSLTEGAAAVVTTDSATVDGGKEGKLVHLSGAAATQETLSDPSFGMSANAIALSREVEMFQWEETSRSEEVKKLGGGTETRTTYDYKETWSSSPINSKGFKVSGYDNPAMQWKSETWHARDVRVGAYRLPQDLVNDITGKTELEATAAQVKRTGSAKAKLSGGGVYVGRDPASPEVGDTRVKFTAIKPGATVSVIGQQSGEALQPYQTKAGKPIALLSMGTKGAPEMFQAAQSANKALTWILRVVGWVLMFVGFAAIFKPLSVVADVLPFIGNIVGFAGTLVAGLLSIAFSSITIAIGWVFYRPLIGIPLVLLGVGALALIVMRPKKKAEAAPA